MWVFLGSGSMPKDKSADVVNAAMAHIDDNTSNATQTHPWLCRRCQSKRLCKWWYPARTHWSPGKDPWCHQTWRSLPSSFPGHWTLFLLQLANISGQTGSCEVEGVDEAEGRGTSSTTWGQVASEVPPELGVLVYTIEEDLLVLVLESKVEGLGGEVSDDICQVSSPERHEALLLGNTHHAVNNALVMHIRCNLFASMLHL